MGIMLWDTTYGGAIHDRGYSVTQTTDGGYIITGVANTTFAASDRQVCLIKTDASGGVVWERYYGGTGEQLWGYSVVQTTDGGYAIAGVCYHPVLPDMMMEAFMLKANAAGDSVWMREYGGTAADWAHCIIQTTDGGYAIAGKTYSFGPADVWLIKTDAAGTMLWDLTFGDSGEEQGECVKQISDTCYVIAGYSSDNGGDAYLIGTCGETPCIPPDSFELLYPASEFIADCSLYVNFEWTAPIIGTSPIYYALYVDGSLVADSLTDTNFDDGWYVNTGDVTQAVNWYVIAFNDCGTKTTMVWKFYIEPCAVCAPAVAWIECPSPCGSFSACEDQGMIFGIADTTGVAIDTTRVYFTAEIYHTDDTADTVYISEDTDSLSFICAPTGCDSLSVILNGFLFDSGDSVIFTLDSLYNANGCLTIP